MTSLVFLSIPFSSASSLHPTGNFHCGHTVCFWRLSLLRVAHCVVSGLAFPPPSILSCHTFSTWVQGLLGIQSCPTTATWILLSLEERPCCGLVSMQIGGLHLICCCWYVVMLFENLPSGAHCLNLCLAIQVDLWWIRSSFRSFTYVGKLKPCISLVCDHLIVISSC